MSTNKLIARPVKPTRVLGFMFARGTVTKTSFVALARDLDGNLAGIAGAAAPGQPLAKSMADEFRRLTGYRSAPASWVHFARVETSASITECFARLAKLEPGRKRPLPQPPGKPRLKNASWHFVSDLKRPLDLCRLVHLASSTLDAMADGATVPFRQLDQLACSWIAPRVAVWNAGKNADPATLASTIDSIRTEAGILDAALELEVGAVAMEFVRNTPQFSVPAACTTTNEGQVGWFRRAPVYRSGIENLVVIRHSRGPNTGVVYVDIGQQERGGVAIGARQSDRKPSLEREVRSSRLVKWHASPSQPREGHPETLWSAIKAAMELASIPASHLELRVGPLALAHVKKLSMFRATHGLGHQVGWLFSAPVYKEGAVFGNRIVVQWLGGSQPSKWATVQIYPGHAVAVTPEPGLDEIVSTPVQEARPSGNPDKATVGVGMPANLYLHEFGRLLFAAFGAVPYHVGSSLAGKAWRDVDVRVLLDAAQYKAMGLGEPGREHENLKWCALTMAFSELGRKMTGLPIDFQLQEASWANAKYDGQRSALVMGQLRSQAAEKY